MQAIPKIVYLSMGSNLGDRKVKLEQAIAAIKAEVGPVLAVSSCYETAAWGLEDQPDFLNIVLKVSTQQLPHQVLETVLSVEERLGRVRKEKWGARVIDIDVLLYGNETISDGSRLQIPHPLMCERKFVLEPLAEIAGAVIHPVSGKDISTLLSLLQDNLNVYRII